MKVQPSKLVSNELSNWAGGLSLPIPGGGPGLYTSGTDFFSLKGYCQGSGHSLALGLKARSNCLQSMGLGTASQLLFGNRLYSLAGVQQQERSASGQGEEGHHEKGATDLPPVHTTPKAQVSSKARVSKLLPTHGHQHPPSATAS